MREIEAELREMKSLLEDDGAEPLTPPETKRPVNDSPGVNQPTKSPTKKISAVGVGGSAAVVIGYVSREYLGVELPMEVAMALAVVVGWASGYARREAS